ncbi:nuclease-related domain-containing protein [Neobacillus sp. DY30]|uniref:nuclease-related domain-containing protein n=1 Tax=Neobacillus sp. DY30 TaxID=3047871 RepID=UPI0024C0D402|nr:nuclease-related domain-containing protein [Neobacillus sp. DY30]WHX99576.1 nuclease-related domain-containing protein [Neobacillus sp. DY30]
MFKKSRALPPEVVILRILNERMELTEKDKQNLWNLEKGYEGEVKFDKLIQHLETLILNDLLLEVSDSLFQIDTLIIFQGKIYLIDIKNYEGEYFYEGGVFKTNTKIEKKDPMLQLKRCQPLLRQLLQKYGYAIPIEAYLVFINPEFTLFQPSHNPQIILPTQVNSFIKKLSKLPPSLTGRDLKLADLLISLHITENPYTRLPKYDYDSLQKGLSCAKCHSFSLSVSRTILTCECGFKERVEPAVMRSVNELHILFPEIKITTNLVNEWCGAVASKKTIRRILKENFKAIGNTKDTYYD